MRYRVVPLRQGLEMTGFGIWDEEISPGLVEQDVKPFVCSLDGQTPLRFNYMTGAYSWLARCEAHGLDLEAGDMRADVYSNGEQGGTVVVHRERGTGRAVVDHPLKRHEK